jgi:hypothetical protein
MSSTYRDICRRRFEFEQNGRLYLMDKSVSPKLIKHLNLMVRDGETEMGEDELETYWELKK